MLVAVCSRAPDGCPYPSGDVIQVETSDIAEFGKLRRYNDFVVRFLARLHDRRVGMICTMGRSTSDQYWLKQMSRACGSRGDLLREGHLEWWISIPEVLP